MKKASLNAIHDYCVSKAADAAEQALEAKKQGDKERFKYWEAKEDAFTQVLDYVIFRIFTDDQP